MNKKILNSKKSQSMVEFVLVFPVFMLCILGIIQFAVIFMNSFMLQYTAYMVARVAVVYNEDERMEKAERALGILKLMTYYSNSIAGNENVKDKMKDVVYDASIDYGASYIKGALNKNSGNLQIDNINIEEIGRAHV
jgi:Flp pilus assembly protein TadG